MPPFKAEQQRDPTLKTGKGVCKHFAVSYSGQTAKGSYLHIGDSRCTKVTTALGEKVVGPATGYEFSQYSI